VTGNLKRIYALFKRGQGGVEVMKWGGHSVSDLAERAWLS